MTKNEVINRLNAIANEANSHDNGYHYEVITNEWVKYGKNRTYFSIVETRDNSKHYVKKDYGFYDNNADEYVAGKANIEYDFGGNHKIEIVEETENEAEAETETIEEITEETVEEFTVISSQRFLDDEIVEEKKEYLEKNNITEITCPVTKAYTQDLDGNDLYILTNMHHTLAAARELGIKVRFEEVENDFTESTDGEEICREYYMGDHWYYINNADPDMIGVDVW